MNKIIFFAKDIVQGVHRRSCFLSFSLSLKR